MAVSVQLDGWAEFEALAARLPALLDEDTEKELEAVGQVFSDSVRRVAPRLSGRLAGSVQLVREGTTVEVAVTARRVSARYPGGFPYPVKVDRQEAFMARAVQAALPAATDRMEQVLDDLQRRWGS